MGYGGNQSMVELEDLKLLQLLFPWEAFWQRKLWTVNERMIKRSYQNGDR